MTNPVKQASFLKIAWVFYDMYKGAGEAKEFEYHFLKFIKYSFRYKYDTDIYIY